MEITEVLLNGETIAIIKGAINAEFLRERLNHVVNHPSAFPLLKKLQTLLNLRNLMFTTKNNLLIVNCGWSGEPEGQISLHHTELIELL